MPATFFEGFTLTNVAVGEAVLRLRHGGRGSPVVLLHGHPRTHTTWYRVASLLAATHTVVCPDLRGYGGSSGPPPGEVTAYSKRAMARDIVELMRSLGHERFAVVGHDRGCYVALRLAMDAPDRVSHLAVLDGIPIGEALARCEARFAASWWHWFFLAQTAKPAEAIINRDPEAWYGPGDPAAMGADNHADWLRATRDPTTVAAMVADYRAGMTIDRSHDDEDRAAGRALSCPTLFAFSAHDDMETLYGDPAAIWQAWAPSLRAARIDSGHHMAEEAPEQLAEVLGDFLSAT